MLAAEGAAATGAAWLPWLIAAIASVLGGGGLAALIRSGREGSKILVDAAAGAVVVQTGVIDSLRKELDDARAEIAELRSHMTEVARLRNRITDLEHENESLKGENEQLRERVRKLELNTPGAAGEPRNEGR